MSFRINDYNAFLSSLCDREPPSGRQEDVEIKQESGDTIPLDFDFGLVSDDANDTETTARAGGCESPRGIRPLVGNTSAALEGAKDTNMYNNNDKMSQAGADLPWPTAYEGKTEISDFCVNMGQGWPAEMMQTGSSHEHQSRKEMIDHLRVQLPAKKEMPQPGLCSYISQQRRRAIEGKTDPATDVHVRTHSHKSKSPHNLIEQRYRDNINDKFVALQNSVPTLRAVARIKDRQSVIGKQSRSSLTRRSQHREVHMFESPSSEEEFEDLQGLEPARKLNKGTILIKSIEYIKFLELKNKLMKQENDELMIKARMLGLGLSEPSESTSADFDSV